MNKTIILILSLVMTLLVIGSGIGLMSYRQSKYKEENKIVQAKIDEKQMELDAIKKEVDANGYRPSDVVNNFFDELNRNDEDAASLYLSSQYNVVFATKSLDFDFKTDQPLLMETNTSISDEDAIVNVSFAVKGSSEYEIRFFYIIKEDNVWKISKIKKTSGVQEDV